MPVVACPQCKTPLSLPDGQAGRFACPKCKTAVTTSVPAPPPIPLSSIQPPRLGTPPPIPVEAPAAKLPMWVWGAAGGVALLCIVGVVLTLVLRHKKPSPPDTGGETRGPGGDKTTAIVRGFLEAKEWPDRLAFVADADTVKPWMKIKYADQPPPQFTKIVVSPPERRTDGGGEWDLVRATWVDNHGTEQRADFVVRSTSSGPKIDWPASTGYNPMTLRAFAAERPQRAIEFRVVCELTDYYNFAYVNARATHYAVKLLEENPYQQMHGYVLKSSPDGQRIYKLLQSGKPVNLMLELQLIRPDGNWITDNDGGGICAINRLVRTAWVDDK
jgi:hypothetical protein